MLDDEDRCYRAVEARDRRFDGWFLFAVRTTGIYCRPSCPAVTPRRANVRFFPSAAAAQGAGFRACKRCRPDAVPGSPEWWVRGDTAARALRLVADGVVDREGVGGLARRLGYSPRQVQRILVAEVGAGPLALARAQRARTARTLVESTALPMTEVAFAAGFSSLRQFHETFREVYATTPTELRRTARGGVDRIGAAGGDDAAAPDELRLRLAVRAPFAADELLAFLARRAVPGVEAVDGGVLRRAVRLPHGVARLRLEAADDELRVGLRLDDLRDLTAAVARIRRLADADADPVAIDEVLGRDAVLGGSVRARPGLRAPGAVDPDEAALRIVFGQQVSLAAASTTLARVAEQWGEPVVGGDAGADRLLPRPEVLATVDPAELPLPAARARAVVGLAGALADGTVRLDGGADRDEVRARLARLGGIGPWTTALVVQRCLGDPDVVVPGDVAVAAGLRSVGVDPADLASCASAWRPWGSYAVHHLWALAATDAARARARTARPLPPPGGLP